MSTAAGARNPWESNSDSGSGVEGEDLPLVQLYECASRFCNLPPEEGLEIYGAPVCRLCKTACVHATRDVNMGVAVLEIEGYGREYGYIEVLEGARGGRDMRRHRVAAAAHYLVRAQEGVKWLMARLEFSSEGVRKMVDLATRFAYKRAEMVTIVPEM